MSGRTSDNPFSEPTRTSDVALVVEGRKLHVCKAVLVLASPVFEKMFYGEFKEKYSSEVPLPGKKHDEMLEFLLCIYPSTFKPVTKHTVEAVMMLADEYQVQRLFDSCIHFLTHDDIKFRSSTSEMVHFLRISESNNNLKKVYDHYLNLVARKCPLNAKVDEFDQISLETRYKVVLKRVQLLEGNSHMSF